MIDLDEPSPLRLALVCLKGLLATWLAGPGHLESESQSAVLGLWPAFHILEENKSECSSWQVTIFPHFLLNVPKEKDC